MRVVVLNWNSLAFTTRCLRALEATSYPADRLEVVLVDNASVDGSLQELRGSFPDLRMIMNDTNLGFAEGCNRAMRDLDGVDMVALVNNDTEVEPGWLEPLQQALASDAEAGVAAACLILDPAFVQIELDMGDGRATVRSVSVDDADVTRRCLYVGGRDIGDPDWPLDVSRELTGKVVVRIPAPVEAKRSVIQLELLGSAGGKNSGGQVTASLGGSPISRSGDSTGAGAPMGGSITFDFGLPTERIELLNGVGTGLTEDLEGFDIGFGIPVEDLELPEVISGFCGGGSLIRSEVLRQVGLFDPRFFAYYEDTDLSWRIRRAGWSIVAVPQSRIHHAFGGAGGAAAPWFFFLNYRNWLLTVIRNGTRVEVLRAVRKAGDLSIRSVRGNIIGRARRGRRPSFRLTAAWIRVWVGVMAGVPRIVWNRSPLARCPVGRAETDRVRSRLQPVPTPRSQRVSH